MTNIGKPYEGKPHVRFDEEELNSRSALHSRKNSRIQQNAVKKLVDNYMECAYIM